MKEQEFLSLKIKAESGDSIAQNQIAHAFCNGDGVAKDLSQAFIWWKKSAEQNNRNSMDNLSWCYSGGNGIDMDNEKALFWIDLIFKQYEGGFDAPTDWERNQRTLCQNNLGWDYYNGINGRQQDFTKAFELFQKSANGGNAYATANLGNCYHTGQGINKDLKKTKELYDKALSMGLSSDILKNWIVELEAEINPMSQFDEAKKLYDSGKKAEAIEIYKKLEKEDSDAACAELAWHYIFEDENVSIAQRYIDKGIKLTNNPLCRAIRGYIRFYTETRVSIPRLEDLEYAIKNLSEKDLDRVVWVFGFLANSYEQADMKKKALATANEGALHKDCASYVMLGQWYMIGRGCSTVGYSPNIVDYNPDIAIECFEHAINDSINETWKEGACRMVLELYALNNVIDYQKIYKYSKFAAEKGVPHSMWALGVAYQNGMACERDLLKGEMWKGKAKTLIDVEKECHQAHTPAWIALYGE